ncbi:hypothetical protein LINPERPRIM_LOCUS29581 [Linum perenne]
MDQKGAGFYFRAGREVKAIREDCLPGKEESKKTLSSISTNLPRRWKSRPAQRITGACGVLRFANKTKKASLTISQSFPAEPRLSSPFEVLPLPSLLSLERSSEGPIRGLYVTWEYGFRRVMLQVDFMDVRQLIQAIEPPNHDASTCYGSA